MKKKYLALGAAVAAALFTGACASRAAEEKPAAKTAEAADTFTTAGGFAVAKDALAHEDGKGPVVYFTRTISPEALVAVYDAVGRLLPGRVGVKISTGESEKSNHLRPELIAPLVRHVKGTLVECNTAYGGNRSTTERHRAAIAERGYEKAAPVDIMDSDGSMTLPVRGGKRLSDNLVGAHFADYDSFLVLSHFKGHAMAGFGGALKNISIGMASSEGKSLIHSGGAAHTGFGVGTPTDVFTEAMADAAKSVTDAREGHMVYVNVMNRLSVDCDCDGNPAEPDMHDVGILASTDPVALDQACMDFLYALPDSASLLERVHSRGGEHLLEAAEALGVGSRTYTLRELPL